MRPWTLPQWWIGLVTASVAGFCICGTTISVVTTGFAAALALAPGSVAAIAGAVWISGAGRHWGA
jgi:hypothetical protein